MPISLAGAELSTAAAFLRNRSPPHKRRTGSQHRPLHSPPPTLTSPTTRLGRLGPVPVSGSCFLCFGVVTTGFQPTTAVLSNSAPTTDRSIRAPLPPSSTKTVFRLSTKRFFVSSSLVHSPKKCPVIYCLDCTYMQGKLPRGARRAVSEPPRFSLHNTARRSHKHTTYVVNSSK